MKSIARMGTHLNQAIQAITLMGISLCTWSLCGGFFLASWTAFRAVRTTSCTAFRAVGTAASWLFF
jgi:hypothetical protein